MNDLVDQAKKIIEENLYATIATSSKNGEPWASPVYVAYNPSYIFYWGSGKNAKHSQNIRENNRVTLIIFDSQASFGKGRGVYIEAKAYELTDPDEILACFMYRYGRTNRPYRQVEEVLGDNPRRIYKAIPEKVWMNQDSEENGFFVDIRVEVPLLQK